MVLWLGEASGIPKGKVAAAKRAALSARPHLPAKSAAIRKIIPWELIEARFRKAGAFQRNRPAQNEQQSE
jgi:hypothetical protein